MADFNALSALYPRAAQPQEIQYPDLGKMLGLVAQMQMAGAHANLYSLEAAKMARLLPLEEMEARAKLTSAQRDLAMPKSVGTGTLGESNLFVWTPKGPMKYDPETGQTSPMFGISPPPAQPSPRAAPSSLPGMNANISDPTNPLPGYALGGRPDPGQPAIVGENGPEVFVPDQPGTVIPDSALNPYSGFGTPDFIGPTGRPGIRITPQKVAEQGMAPQAPIPYVRGAPSAAAPQGKQTIIPQAPGGEFDPTVGPAFEGDEWKNGFTSWGQEVQPPGTITKQDAGRRNEQFLSQLSPNVQAIVKDVVDYKVNPMARANAFRLLAAAARYDPDYDVRKFNATNKVMSDYMGAGKQGMNFVSNNMALQHIGSALNNIEFLQNSNIPIWNVIKNNFKYQTGDTETQTRLKQLQTDINAISSELVRTFRNSNVPSEREATDWKKNLNVNDSPAGLRGAFQEAAKLLFSRTSVGADYYNQTMGPQYARPAESWLGKEALISLKRALTLDPQNPTIIHAKTDADLAKVQPGAKYIDANGQMQMKPGAQAPANNGLPVVHNKADRDALDSSKGDVHYLFVAPDGTTKPGVKKKQ